MNQLGLKAECSIVSAVNPDWAREECRCFWDPSRRLLRSLRRYQYWFGRQGLLSWLMRKRWALSHRFWSVVTGAEIPLGVQIRGGLLIPHPNGVVIHGDAEIGVNCLIFQQVTVGSNEPKAGVPRIGGQVDIGAGARVLGNVAVGDHAKIGANAVVLVEVPAGATAVGVPARIILPTTHE